MFGNTKTIVSIDLKGVTWQEVKAKIKKATDEFVHRKL